MKRFWLLTTLAALCMSCSQELTPKGDLNVVGQGLPATQNAQVTITGPNGFNSQITLNGADSFALDGLPPGAYSVDPADVPGFRAVDTTTATVTNTGKTQVTLVFTRQSGVLNVTVAGLLEATPAVITVRGPAPSTTEQTLAFTTNGVRALGDLQPGRYAVVPATVPNHAAPTAQTVDVQDAQTSSVTLTYVPMINLEIVVNGMNPRVAAGDVGSFTLTGPNNFSRTETNDNQTFDFDGLLPGTYTLTIDAPANHDLLELLSPRTLTLNPPSNATQQTATEQITYRPIIP
jgi:hypothetical protein